MNLVTKKENKELIIKLVSQGMSESIILTLPLDIAENLLKEDLSVKSSNVRESIILDICNHIDKENKFKYSFIELEQLVRFINLDGYFDLGTFKPATVADVKGLQMSNLITSNKDTDNNAIRFDKWQKRAKSYIKSHVIGTVAGNLNANENLKYKCSKDSDGIYNFTLRTLVARPEEV